jgi:Sulfotransferase domain
MLMSDIDFLIIGAAKSATTWLQRSLVNDPLVLMPPGDLELHYFSRQFSRGNDWYFSNFPKKRPGQLLGERSNSYLATPGMSQRIFENLPHAKLIAQLRNPVDRAYSDYCMLFRRGEVGRDIASYLDPRKAQDKRFLADGQYHSQLNAYLELFPENQLLVLLYEEMKTDPAAQLSKLRSYLGLSDHIPSAINTDRVKDKSVPVVHPALKRHFGWLKPMIAPVRKNRIIQNIRERLVTDVEYPKLQPELRSRLTDHFAPEVEKMEIFMGRKLVGW